jgi:hypothetical protein
MPGLIFISFSLLPHYRSWKALCEHTTAQSFPLPYSDHYHDHLIFLASYFSFLLHPTKLNHPIPHWQHILQPGTSFTDALVFKSMKAVQIVHPLQQPADKQQSCSICPTPPISNNKLQGEPHGSLTISYYYKIRWQNLVRFFFFWHVWCLLLLETNTFTKLWFCESSVLWML